MTKNETRKLREDRQMTPLYTSQPLYPAKKVMNVERIVHKVTTAIAAILIGFIITIAFMDAAFAARSTNGYSKNEIKQIIIEEAQRDGVVPPALALAVARVESNFRAGVESSAGARGVMQIMPATARGEFGVGANKLWDPRLNIRLGIKFLHQLYNQYGHKWDLALSHYNGGTLKGRGANARPHSYTRKYVSDVTRHWRKFSRNHIVLASAEKVNNIKVSEGNTERFSWGTAKPSDSYWLLEEATVERNWRDYLNEADRILSGDAPTASIDNEVYFDGYDVVSENGDVIALSSKDLANLRIKFKNSLQRTLNKLDAPRKKRFM